MFKKGADMTGKTDTPIREIKGKAYREFLKKIKNDKKKRGPIATINPPKRGGKRPIINEPRRPPRPPGAPRNVDPGFDMLPGRPTRLPRYDRMPGNFRPRPKKPRP
jgi:hypothetical protein